MNYGITQEVIKCFHFFVVLPGTMFLLGANNQTRGQKVSELSGPTISYAVGRNSRDISFNNDLGLISVPVSVNDSASVWFILDTGFEISLIDVELAKQMDLRLENVKSIAQPGGTVEMGTVPSVKLGLKGLTLTRQPLQTAPLKPLEKAIGRQFAGILGHDILEHFIIEIDYQNNRISFFDPKTYKYKGKGQSINLEIVNGEPFLTGMIRASGQTPFPAKLKLDTGSVSGIGFNKNFIDAYHLPSKGQKVVEVPGVAVGGDTKNIAFRIESFKMRSYTFRNLPVGATIDSEGFENRNDAGTIGAEILTKFKLILDYPHSRLFVEPNPSFDRPFQFDRAGISFSADGNDHRRLSIYKVSENSPAAKAGLMDGDNIVSINNISSKHLSIAKLWTMMRQRNGAVYKITVKRGSIILRKTLILRTIL